MNMINLVFLLVLASSFAMAQKLPNFVYSEDFANEDLRGQSVSFQGKLVAVRKLTDNIFGSSETYFLLDKSKPGKTILTCVSQKENSAKFGGDGKMYVDNVRKYEFTPEIIKNLTFKENPSEKGTYIIESPYNNIPFEEISEKKVKPIRWGYGEEDAEGYELLGANNVMLYGFDSKKDFENFKKEFLK